jgi:hypothetical protein
MTMTTVYRDFTCAATAALITVVLALAFVQSTSLPYGMHSAPATQTRSA